jgi:hypothetical protein
LGVGGWCWYPGPVFAHYSWSPAFVGFFGWGGGIGVGFGFGGLGWVPLAPFEVFHPWWGRGFYGGFRGGAFARGSYVVRNANIESTYRNARVNGGVSGVNANQFGRAGAQVQALNRSQIQSAGLVHGAVPVAPGRSSLQMSNRTPSGNYPQSRAQNFASHMQTPQVSHVSFNDQQRGMQGLSRSDLTSHSTSLGSTGIGSRGNSGLSRTTPGSGSAGASGGGTGHGWNRFGEPIHGSSGSSSQSLGGPARPSTNASGGWQRSGDTRPGGSYSGTGSRYSSPGYAGGNGQAIRINPSIVQQRSQSGANSTRTTSSGGSTRSSGTSSAPRSSGGSSGGGHSGGGGHGGGGHR